VGSKGDDRGGVELEFGDLCHGIALDGALIGKRAVGDEDDVGSTRGGNDRGVEGTVGKIGDEGLDVNGSAHAQIRGDGLQFRLVACDEEQRRTRPGVQLRHFLRDRGRRADDHYVHCVTLLQNDDENRGSASARSSSHCGKKRRKRAPDMRASLAG
jgi:hypothetical protein